MLGTLSIDDSTCNLASINLMKFRREDGDLAVEAFEHTVDTVFLAQEIIVGIELPDARDRSEREGLPTARPRLREPRRAPDVARASVRLGRGPRLRRRHRAHDRSRLPQVGRDHADRMGRSAGYQPNAGAMIGVIAKHRAAVENIEHAHSVPDDLLSAARKSWDDAPTSAR